MYSLIPIIYKGKSIPCVVDTDIYEKIKTFSFKFINNKIVTKHKGKDISLHEIVMFLHGNNRGKSILHINKIVLDNRIDNLTYDDKKKSITKNIDKKKRTLELEGIDNNIIPTYIWYNKPYKNIGERFTVKIGDFIYKTTSNKSLSMYYKLEEAKKVLRYIREFKPHFFCKYSMNGDLNTNGKKLLKEFIQIANEHGFKFNLEDFYDNTDNLLEKCVDYLNDHEKKLLHDFNPLELLNM